MSKRRQIKRGAVGTSTAKRLARIDTKLSDIQRNVNLTVERLDDLERVIDELDDIKKDLKKKRRRGFSLLKKKRRRGKESPSNEIPQIEDLMKNPSVKSLLKKNGIGKSDLLKLMQNPMVQSMLKNLF